MLQSQVQGLSLVGLVSILRPEAGLRDEEGQVWRPEMLEGQVECEGALGLGREGAGAEVSRGLCGL